MKIDWSKAPDWAQWLAVDADGEAYWYSNTPRLSPNYPQWNGAGGHIPTLAFHVEEPEDYTQELYERPTTNEEKTMAYTINTHTVIEITDRSSYAPVEIYEAQWRGARELVSLVDPHTTDFPRVKLIKLYRNLQPGLGLREATVAIEAAWQERRGYC